MQQKYHQPKPLNTSVWNGLQNVIPTRCPFDCVISLQQKLCVNSVSMLTAHKITITFHTC